MSAVTVPASSVRVPSEAREALSQREAVTVVAHKRSQYVILHPDDYAVVSPMLERHRAGRPIPVERLLTEDDFAIIREESNAAPDDGILESWLS
jgi:PHD/YefM family antitoxin component YafN of YafNO toxin-antitoxin module